MSQHTATLSCGCTIGRLKHPTKGELGIIFCPTHAAAPELLEACKAAKQAIANAISFVNDEASPTASTEISALFAQLYAAIAKATE